MLLYAEGAMAWPEQHLTSSAGEKHWYWLVQVVQHLYPGRVSHLLSPSLHLHPLTGHRALKHSVSVMLVHGGSSRLLLELAYLLLRSWTTLAVMMAPANKNNKPIIITVTLRLLWSLSISLLFLDSKISHERLTSKHPSVLTPSYLALLRRRMCAMHIWMCPILHHWEARWRGSRSSCSHALLLSWLLYQL